MNSEFRHAMQSDFERIVDILHEEIRMLSLQPWLYDQYFSQQQKGDENLLVNVRACR
jgi:hypothetical protein